MSAGKKLLKLLGLDDEYKAVADRVAAALGPDPSPAVARAALRREGVPVPSQNTAASRLRKVAERPRTTEQAATPPKPKEKTLAAKPEKSLAARPAAPPNPTQVIAEEYSPEIARRVRDSVSPDAPVSEWRAVADKLQGTISNRPYQPENDLAFRDFDLSSFGIRKTMDYPRLIDLDVTRARRTPEPQRETLSFQDLVNRPYMTGMSDLTPSGTTITRIGRTDLDIPVEEYGGQDYMYDNPFAWAVSTPTMGSNFMNAARGLKREYGVNPIWLPYRMRGSGSDFSKTTGETLMSYANSALGLDARNAMNRFIRENYIPDFAGIDNPRGYLQFGDLKGPQRKAMQEGLSDTFAQEGGLSLPITRAVITDPNQLSRRSFTLQNVAEIDPDAGTVLSVRNPTYHYNASGNVLGTLDEDLQDRLNVAELIAPTLRAKYADLGDLSVFRGQKAPLSLQNFARQQAEYEDLKAAFDVKLAAGNTKAKAPRVPVPVGNTNKFMQSVFATGYLDDVAAQELYDRLYSSGAQSK